MVPEYFTAKIGIVFLTTVILGTVIAVLASMF